MKPTKRTLIKPGKAAAVPPPTEGEVPAPQTDETAETVETEVASEEEGPQRVAWTVRHDLKKRMDLYLRDRFPDFSRTALQKLVQEGAVTINGRKAKSSTTLHTGDRIEVTLPPRAPDEILPENIPLEIIYEDDQFLAINKQPSLIVHPARGHWSGTLINGLVYYAQQTNSQLSVGSDPWRPGIIHRLDRDTTGIILIAKTDEAHWRIAGQFERRTTQKTYLAIVHGVPEFDSDLIDAPLAVHPRMRELYAVRPEVGKPAQTVYKVLERFDGFALLELQPKTGRTHQLRVHCAHIGHPIVGDVMYGGRAVSLWDLARGALPDTPENRTSLINRQALHAWRIQFVHPKLFHRVALEAPLYQDIKTLFGALQKYRKKA